MHLIYLKNSAKALCSISLGTAVIPRRIEKQRLCKNLGAKKVHYGKWGNGEMCGVYKIQRSSKEFFGPGELYLVGPAEKLL